MAYILGLDIGYSNMKLAGGEHGALNPTVLLRPAGTAPAERVAIPLASTEEGRRVMVNEQAWMAGVAQERIEPPPILWSEGDAASRFEGISFNSGGGLVEAGKGILEEYVHRQEKSQRDG